MDHALWQRLHPFLDRAFELPPTERAEWLARLHEESPEVAEELEHLLAREGTLDRRGFLDTPVSLDSLVGAAFAGATTGYQREELTVALAPRYVIQAEVGRGGMATVLRARDTRHDRDVAIKVIRPDAASTLGADRFLAEIRLTASLTHPNILPLLDSGQANGMLYYVMPLVEGESLRARLRREGALPVDDVKRLVRVVLEALDHAHSRGLVHRDIKPDNVLIAGRQAWLADFGIAKAIADAGTGSHAATSVGMALGSPGYMAPEQIEGSPTIDARADLYAVGVTAWEMLAGRVPFAADSLQQLLLKHLTTEPEALDVVRPGLPRGLSEVVMRCLAKRPDDRWPSALAALDALDQIETGRSSAPVPASQGARLRGRALATAAGALAAGVAGWWYLGRSPAMALTAPQRLTSVGRLEQPRLSPNGEWLAWLSGPQNRTIFVQHVDSSSPRRLAQANNGLLAWLDDSTVAATPDDSAPILVDLRTGAHLPNAWLRARAGRWRRVPGARGTVWNVLYSLADSTRVTLTMAQRRGPGDVVAFGLARGERVAWVSGSLEDGRMVAALRAVDSSLRIVRVARSGELGTVLSVPVSDTTGLWRAVSVFSGFVAPSGRFAYIYHKRDTLWRVDLRTRQAQPERLALDMPGIPSDMSANGDMIVPSLLNTSRVHRFSIPPDPTRNAELVVEFSGPAVVIPNVSPDGALLAQTEALPGSRRSVLYLQRPDGTARRQLLPIDGLVAALQWSPDGTQLVGRHLAAVRPMQWIVIDTRTGATTYLGVARAAPGAQIASLGFPAAWSPDSRSVFVSASERHMPREVRRYTLIPGDSGAIVSRWWEEQNRPRPDGLVVSPDVARLAVGGASLVVVDLRTGGTRELVPAVAGADVLPLSWTASGELRYVSRRVASRGPSELTMYAVSAVGGPPHLLGTVQANCRDAPTVMASGTEGACLERDQTIDAYRIRGFR